MHAVIAAAPSLPQASVISLDSRRAPARTALLSRRECEVLVELARGLHTEEIARALFLSPHTVRAHVKAVLRKLEARTRAHAVAIGIAEGVIELDPFAEPALAV